MYITYTAEKQFKELYKTKEEVKNAVAWGKKIGIPCKSEEVEELELGTYKGLATGNIYEVVKDSGVLTHALNEEIKRVAYEKGKKIRFNTYGMLGRDIATYRVKKVNGGYYLMAKGARKQYTLASNFYNDNYQLVNNY